MSTEQATTVTSASAWKGEDLKHDTSWCHRLTGSELGCLERALLGLKSKDLAFPEFTREDFPLPELTNLFSEISRVLEEGRGFALVKGLPVSSYSEDEINALYYGIGLHLGSPVTQNPRGDLLGRVMNVGDVSNPETRVYETNAYLPYHTDPSDVVGLLCIRAASHGGMSSLVSATTVYNVLLERYPEFVPFFYKPTYYAHMGGDLPKLTPLYSFHQGKLSCRYLRQYIELGNEIMGNDLSADEIAAMDAFDSITQEANLRLDMMLEPGDIQFANNYTVLHSRNKFEDTAEVGLRRKMLRLWLKMPNARELAPDFPGRNGFSDDL